MESRFYIADDIQTLEGGKLAMMGVYADTVLLVHLQAVPGKPKAPALMPTLPRLCMLVNITDIPAGKYSMTPKITLPSGKPAPTMISMEMALPKGGAANALMRFETFPIPEFGVYKLSMRLANKTIEHTFEVRQAASVQQVPKAPARKPKAAPKKALASPPRKRASA